MQQLKASGGVDIQTGKGKFKGAISIVTTLNKVRRPPCTRVAASYPYPYPYPYPYHVQGGRRRGDGASAWR